MWSRGLLITGLAILGGLALLGLPGVAVFTVSRPALALLFGRGFMKRMPEGAMWPMAIGLTLLWPLGFWPVHALMGDLNPWGKVGALYLWGVLLSAALYYRNRK